MFRTIQTIVLLGTLCATLPAATFNVGQMFLSDNGDGTGSFNVENLTGTSSLAPDFPVLSDLSFSGTLTVLYCELNEDCSEPANVTTTDLTFDVPFLPGSQNFPINTNVQFLFDQFTFNGSFLPTTPFEVAGVFYQPVNQVLNFAYLGDPGNPTWLFSIEGREVDTEAIPEPSSLLLLSAGALLFLRRR